MSAFFIQKISYPSCVQYLIVSDGFLLSENVWLKTKAVGDESLTEKPCPHTKLTLWYLQNWTGL